MKNHKFTEKQIREFEFAANPHQWLLSADSIHNQALSLYKQRGRGKMIYVDENKNLHYFDETNKSTFLLCSFALENAIKAFLVYEYPQWISNGHLHNEICSHKLVALSEKSSLIPYKRRDRWVLAAFEEGNESWMRYPCPRRATELQVERQLRPELWSAYLRVTRGYGAKLARLLRKGWRGQHGFSGRWVMSGEWLGARSDP